jgi:hypothetical protein
MTTSIRSQLPAEPSSLAPPSLDLSLVELVDAIVAAADTSRCAEIDRLRFALEPFGGISIFDAEIRL